MTPRLWGVLVGLVSPSCSGSVLGGSGFRRGSLPRGSLLTCLAECPAWIFLFVFRLQWRTAHVSDAATRRIIALFSRNFSATVCMSTHGHLRRQTYRQTDRQTDHGTYHAMPCQGGRGGESVACHTTPYHDTTVVQTSSLLYSANWHSSSISRQASSFSLSLSLCLSSRGSAQSVENTAEVDASQSRGLCDG
jgi:hypothetical protein